MDLFEEAYEEVMGHEGGYGNDASDPGGETYKGVARNRWKNWPGWSIIDKHKVGLSSTKELNAVLAQDITLQKHIRDFYREHFWDEIWGDELAKLSEPVAKDMFDMAVNLGTGRATQFLQRAANSLNNRQLLYPDILVDGSFGTKTMQAVKSCIKSRDENLLYKAINILQGAWYLELMEGNEKFEKYIGWFNRVEFIS